MHRRVAVLHHPHSFFPLDLRAAVGDCAELLWVLADECSDDEPSRRLLRRLGTVVDVAGLDLDEAASALAGHEPQGIVTFVDDHLVTTAGLAARLGLPYHSPEVAATIADKQLQRAALTRAGVPGPRFWPLPWGLDPDALGVIGQRIRYPAVIKPALGSGSRGVLALAGPEDLIALYRPGVAQLVEERLADDPVHADPFASYLSVESVVSEGGSSHVAITGRFPLATPFRETGNFIPGAIDPSLHEPLFELTDAAIQALGITTGVLHTEIKLTPDGPRLIELNGRLGGRPPFVLQSVCDVNLFQVACELALGVPVHFPGLVPCRGIGYWHMHQAPQAAVRVRDVRGLTAVSQAHHVDSVALKHRPGEPVDWREGTDGQVLTVRGRVSEHDALAEAIAFIQRTVEIDYEVRDQDDRGRRRRQRVTQDRDD